MANLRDTYNANFLGVDFLVKKTETSGGRKDVLHAFPNSDKQNIEDLGLKPRTLNVSGFIHGNLYERKRDRLLEALESGDKGVLTHPFLGRFDSMVCRSFTMREDFSEFGIAYFDMVFTVSNDIGIPKGSENALSFINGKNSALQDALNKDLGGGFSVSNIRNSIQNATESLNRMFNAIDEKTKIVSQSASAMDDFSALINTFSTNINDLARKPQDLADSLQNIHANINGLYAVVDSVTGSGNSPSVTTDQQNEQSAKTLAVYESFFNYDDNQTRPENTTASRLLNNLNNALLKQNLQASSLGYAYLNAAQINYSTVDEINKTAESLENQFQKVLENQNDINNLTDLSRDNNGIDTESMDALNDLRDSVQSFFDTAKLTTNRVLSAYTEEMPASVLTYQYYGSLELENDIIELNTGENVSFFSGDVSILGE